jgi:hypothetical protein
MKLAPPQRHRPIQNRHGLAEAVDVTSSVITLKPASVHGPNEVAIATSVASRPRAIRMRPMRRAPSAEYILPCEQF